MTAYFSDPGRLARLADEAETWRSTPFNPNGEAKGHGVSCQKLVGLTLEACGAFPHRDWPDGSVRNTRSARLEIMHRFLSQDLVGFVERAQWPPAPGDLVTFSFGHAGIILPGDILFHCLSPAGVQFNRVKDATWLAALAAIWRPVEHEL